MSKARHGPCSQGAPELAGEKMCNQAIRNQCEREVSLVAMGTRGEATAAAPLRRVVAGEKGDVKQADLFARPNSAWPSRLTQDKIWHNKICHLSVPPSSQLRNEKGDCDTKAA